MGKGLPRVIGFIVLCGLIGISSVQAFWVDSSPEKTGAEASE